MPVALFPQDRHLACPTANSIFNRSNMKILNSAYFWCFSFTILFLLSLDFWSWEKPTSFFLFHLPSWTFYFFGLQIILSCAMLIFSKTFWVTENREENKQ